MAQTFPFGFDASKMADLFEMPKFDGTGCPVPGMEDFSDACKKNMAAMLNANKVASQGYKEIYERQTALMGEMVAAANDHIAQYQAEPVSTDAMTKNIALMKAAFDKSVQDTSELFNMAQEANTKAYDVIKSRMEEIYAENKAVLAKATA